MTESEKTEAAAPTQTIRHRWTGEVLFETAAATLRIADELDAFVEERAKETAQ